jgi:hypothetical protein
MAFNPSPKVAAARELATRYKQTKVIILMIDDEQGSLEYASYGKDRYHCVEAQKLAGVAYFAIYRQLESK